MNSKRQNTILRAGVAAMALAAMIADPAVAQQPQVKPELEAMLLMADGTRKRGFVQDTNEQGILFALVERGPGNGFAWGTQVTAVAFDAANDIIRNARAAYSQGQLEEAAKAFGQIADAYANMAWVPDGFAAEARYYQIESLRQLGRYQEIAPLLETPTAKAIEKSLGEFYQSQHALNKIWAQAGAGQWDGVQSALEERQKPVVGNESMLPTPVFVEMPEHELVQLLYLRATIFDKAGEKQKALSDYYKTLTLTFANNADLALPAMKAAMAIHKEDPQVADKEAKNNTGLWQMQSLAYLYKNAFGGGEISSEFAEFAVMPNLPKPPPAEEEPEPDPTAAPGEEKPADGKDMDKGKGKGKGEPAKDDGKAKGKGKGAEPDDKGKADDKGKGKGTEPDAKGK